MEAQRRHCSKQDPINNDKWQVANNQHPLATALMLLEGSSIAADGSTEGNTFGRNLDSITAQ